MVNNKKNRGKQDYKPSEIEPYWQKIWEEKGIYSPNLDTSTSLSAKKPFDKAQGKPFYNLMMFPYPSAEGMHVGNMYAFTGADVYGRFKRMQGYDVFEPIGLDGFGIHSENYAIKVGQHPKEQAKISERNFYRQLRATGNGFDWSRKLETYDPKYYKWTQWLFIQLFKAGLAYRAKAKVNWCASCKTVLADEQVVSKKLEVRNGKLERGVGSEKDGRTSHFANPASHLAPLTSIAVCERCETEVTKKDLEQWFFRITKYAETLLANLARLDWSEKVKIAQRQWIGKSEGAVIKFSVIAILSKSLEKQSQINGIATSQASPGPRNDKLFIEVFTTRPDTLYGATFLVLSPEHQLVNKLINREIASSQAEPDPRNDNLKEIKKYVEQAKKKIEQERMAEGKEKTGVFTRLYAVNPVNNEKIPIWIADYAVMGYGTGAIMGVPAHDQRDFEFARKYSLPIKNVIASSAMQNEAIPTFQEIASSQAEPDPRNDKKEREAYTGKGIIVNSAEWNGWKVPEQIGKVIDWLEKKGIGKKEVSYHLRDWLISRQRYWGPPIPMIYCESCAKKGESWFTTDESLEIEGKFWKSEEVSPWDILSSTMSGWFPVSDDQLPVLLPDVKDWKPTGSGKSPLATVESFVNTQCPNCKGSAKRETDVSDTFLDSAWYFFRYVSTDIDNTAFDIERVKKWLPVKMYIGGAEHSVLHLLYARFITMALKDIGLIDFEEPFSRFYAHGLLIKEGAKMSKSKGNVVVPDEYIKKFGADTLRMYLMFLGPFNQGGDFYDTALEGMYRFLKRVWKLIIEHLVIVSRQLTEKQSQDEGIASSPAERDPRNDMDRERLAMMHRTIKKVTEDISNLRYNTAIAAMMEWYNYLSVKLKAQSAKLTREEAETYLKLLAPFAPHMTEELFQQFFRNSKFEIRNSNFNSIHLQPWPKYDPKFLEEDEVTIVVQVNGKLRDTLKVQSAILRQAQDKSQKYAEELARKSQRVRKYLEGKEIKKVVYVEGKVINFVTV